jgi:hypothetical protein
MTALAPGEMLRNSKPSILWLIGIVGLIAFALVKLSLSTSGSIGLRLDGYSNACARVRVTNLSRSQVDYVMKVERKTMNGWPKYQGGIPVSPDGGQSGVLRPGQVTTLSLPVMVYAPPYPWRVSFFCYRNPVQLGPIGFQPGTLRFKAGLWLLRLHMPKLAQKLWGEFKVVQVSGPQMEQ